MADINDILIEEDKTVIQAMEALDRVAKKTLFVSKNNQLIAAITDGDIRRWILSKGSLDAKVKDVANYRPIFLMEKERDQAKEIMKKFSIEALPIVDDNMNITAVIFWDDKNIEQKNSIDVPVVIMAGGLGTRLYPYTKILPKPLIPIGEIPIAEHIINNFKRFGCNDFYMIVNHKKNMIKAYFNEIEKDYSISFVDEDKPLGTGGGLSLLKGKISKAFILSNCDILIFENFAKIYEFHKKEKNLITMICSLKTIKIPYGVIEIGENGEIGDMKEKPEIPIFTNTGCYLVEPQIVEDLEDDFSIGFPDIIDRYREGKGKVGLYPISEKSWMDMGKLDEMDDMRKRLKCDE